MSMEGGVGEAASWTSEVVEHKSIEGWVAAQRSHLGNSRSISGVPNYSKLPLWTHPEYCLGDEGGTNCVGALIIWATDWLRKRATHGPKPFNWLDSTALRSPRIASTPIVGWGLGVVPSQHERPITNHLPYVPVRIPLFPFPFDPGQKPIVL